MFTSTHPDTFEVKVPYVNAYPLFIEFAVHIIEIDDFITKVNTSKNPRYTLHNEADKILAKKPHTKPSKIRKYRRKEKLTWHEVEDMRTLQLVPTVINAKFGHLGGISEAKIRGINNELYNR